MGDPDATVAGVPEAGTIYTILLDYCSSGLIRGGEDCDDGNLIDGDGCSSFCRVENGFTCDNGSGPSVCSSSCGDGIIDRANEECDDGNRQSGDGCSTSCQFESALSNGGIAGIVVAGFCLICCVVGALIAVSILVQTRKQKAPPISLDTFSNYDIPIIDQIDIGQKLGSGNFGDVFKGEWNGTAVALKSVRAEDSQDFISELKILK